MKSIPLDVSAAGVGALAPVEEVLCDDEVREM
jgi:hypothetical protein